MVLQLKLRKSRSPPGFEASAHVKSPFAKLERAAAGVSPSGGFSVSRDGNPARMKRAGFAGSAVVGDAGWSSPVARQAHNLKVVGSNPTPATNVTERPRFGGGFLSSARKAGLSRRLFKRQPEKAVSETLSRHAATAVKIMQRCNGVRSRPWASFAGATCNASLRRFWSFHIANCPGEPTLFHNRGANGTDRRSVTVRSQ